MPTAPDPDRHTTVEKRGATEVVYVTSAALVAANQGIDLVQKLKPKKDAPKK
jgi:hypothetical protein